MNDYTAMIAMLRDQDIVCDQAADALEAQAKEIAIIQTQRDAYLQKGLAQAKEIAELRAEIETLKAEKVALGYMRADLLAQARVEAVEADREQLEVEYEAQAKEIAELRAALEGRKTEMTYEEAEKCALKAIHGTDGRGMVGQGRHHMHQRVARAILHAHLAAFSNRCIEDGAPCTCNRPGAGPCTGSAADRRKAQAAG